MVQGLKSSIAIVGAGPAGCMTACCLDKSFEITLFDLSSPLKTLLPTGGGKCNLAHAEYDFRELVKSYPRGEKFLYSIFSRFCTSETVEFFEKIGVKTYTREDDRIFPVSNSSQEVREKILNQLHHCKFQKEEVLNIKQLANGLELKTNKSTYLFDVVVVATGGKHGYKLLQDLGHRIEEPKQALVGLKTEPSYKELQGVTVQNCVITSAKKHFHGNVLFTDSGITGPAVFELSSINARLNMPYSVEINFLPQEVDWQELFNSNPLKQLGNLLAEYLPKSFVNALLSKNNIDATQKCCVVKSNTKVLVNKLIKNNRFNVIGTRQDGEIVTCGGLVLKDFDGKTLESKLIKNVYACGEVLDIDGFCGGYNLQACWSEGYIVATAINSTL